MAFATPCPRGHTALPEVVRDYMVKGDDWLRCVECGAVYKSRQRMTLYRTIVADPPWKRSLDGTWTAKDYKGAPQTEYPLMELDAIKALRVPAAEQAHLYLWCLSQSVDWGFEVARAWGFEPVILWTWAKPALGVGRFRCNTEHIVVARKGSRHGNPFGQGGRHAQATDGTWFSWPRAAHSEKPQAFYSLVETISPGPRLEMFARQRRLGWDAWGNEVESSVSMEGA